MSARSYTYVGVNGIIRANINKEGKTVRVARLERFTITVDPNLLRVNEIGSRMATEILERALDIDGTIDKYIWDGRMLKAVIGSVEKTPSANFPDSGIIDTQTNPNPSQLEYEIIGDMPISPGSVERAFLITLKFVKFARWVFTMPLNEKLTESIPFMARHIRVESTQDVAEPPINQ